MTPLEKFQMLSKSQTILLKRKFQHQLNEKDQCIQTLRGRVHFLSDENEILKSSLEALQGDRNQLQNMRRLLQEAQIALRKRQQPVLTLDLSNVLEELAQLRQELTQLRTAVSAPLDNLFPVLKSQLKERLSTILSTYQEEMKERKRLYNLVQELRGNIRVFCRIRPVAPVAAAALIHGNETVASEMLKCVSAVLALHEQLVVVRALFLVLLSNTWTFDHVFSLFTTEDNVFNQIRPLVGSVLDGYNATIFSYGQTGSGKTHCTKNITLRTVRQMICDINARKDQYNDRIELSMMEIYNEKLRDLLDEETSKSSLSIRQSNDGKIHVPDLKTFTVDTVDEIQALIARGEMNRATESTKMNDVSSRSHLILSLTVQSRHKHLKQLSSVGKLYLIDLAGSERLSRTQATGIQLKEAQNINKSLSALGDVIQARGNKKATHVPYRNSTLTFLLQDALQGDAKTLMIACVNPLLENVSESFCTLNFATRARAVELGPAKRNEIL